MAGQETQRKASRASPARRWLKKQFGGKAGGALTEQRALRTKDKANWSSDNPRMRLTDADGHSTGRWCCCCWKSACRPQRTRIRVSSRRAPRASRGRPFWWSDRRLGSCRAVNPWPSPWQAGRKWARQIGGSRLDAAAREEVTGTLFSQEFADELKYLLPRRNLPTRACHPAARGLAWPPHPGQVLTLALTLVHPLVGWTSLDALERHRESVRVQRPPPKPSPR